MYKQQNPSRRSEGFSFVGPDSKSTGAFWCDVAPAARTMAHRDRTAWLGMQDSNLETSSQIIPLKDRSNSRDPAEFWPQTIRV